MRIENKEEIQPTGDGARSPIQEPCILRELDYAVAECVMGWRWWRTTLRYSTEVRRALMPAGLQNEEWQLADGTEEIFAGEHSPFVPHYSTDIAAAMEAVEKLLHRVGVDIESWETPAFTGWQVKLWANGDIAGEAQAASLPEAICRAALALVDGPQKETK